MNIYIFGFLQEGKFVPESLFGNLEESTKTLKYWAVQQVNYGIWEYPSGKVYSIKADRKLDVRDSSSIPSENSWLPIYEIIKTDPEIVSKLFKEIKENPKLLKRGSIRWLRPWETLFFRSSSVKKFIN